MTNDTIQELSLKEIARVQEERARLLAVSSQSASDWLHAIPIPSLGLKLDPMSRVWNDVELSIWMQ